MEIDYTHNNRDEMNNNIRNNTIEGNNNNKLPERVKDEILKRKNLTPEQCQQLRDFILEFADTFYDSNQPLRNTHVTTHEIRLQPGKKPINAHAFHHRPADRIEIDKQINDMLKKNVIQPSMSP